MPDEETKSLLRRNLELAEDNNRMLHSMRRMAFWGGLFKFLWWFAILVLIPAAAYYVYIAPYVPQLMNSYKELQSGVNQVRGMQTSVETGGIFGNLLKQFEAYQASKK